MGILIHYFWLSAFAAMSVCSYHMWRVFSSIKTADHDTDQRRRFLQYTVYIWGTAAAVVVLTLLGHIIATEGDTIGRWNLEKYSILFLKFVKEEVQVVERFFFFSTGLDGV